MKLYKPSCIAGLTAFPCNVAALVLHQTIQQFFGNGVHSASCLGEKSSGSGLENQEYGPRDPSRSALTSVTNGSRLVGIVRLRTEATECLCLFLCLAV
jgi:hypothetical protein